MRWLPQVFDRRKLYRDLTEEMRGHLEERTEQLVREGMSQEDAELAAPRTFGNPTLLEERGCEVWQWVTLESIWADVRYALRQLSKSPGFTAAAIAVLALGICSSVAIFAFVDAALIKPLPYREPQGLVAVYEKTNLCPRCNVSYLNFRDWKKRDLPFSSFEVWGYSRYLLNASSQGAQSVPGARVTDGFFGMLGVTPVLGRDFYPGEDSPGAPHTALLSYAAWQKRFSGSSNVIGQSITLSDTSYTIIGVLPSSFQFAPIGAAEFWTALNEPISCELRRGCHNLFGIGRVKDGVTRQSALAAMQSIAQQLEKQYPENRGYGADVVALTEAISGSIRPILLVLLGGAGLLLSSVHSLQTPQPGPRPGYAASALPLRS
jgi:macrolide transport system ATP-binding/permease protein